MSNQQHAAEPADSNSTEKEGWTLSCVQGCGRNMAESVAEGTTCSCIVACGQKHVLISKSQLQFPAWLVRFSSFSEDGPIEHKSSNRTQFWRSKRDFLRLARVVHQNNPKLFFPKAAFRKLSDASPWIRPHGDSVAAGLADRVAVDTETQHNHWHISMQKSLGRLDRFLTNVHSMVALATATNNQGNRRINDLEQAWSEFCRLQDCDQLQCREESTPTDDRVGALTSAAARGNALGQYFCAPALAQQLVQSCLEKLSQQLQITTDHDREMPPTPLLFVEPSCGHGQVIDALLEALAERRTHPIWKRYYNSRSQIQIVGIDKDEAAVSHCLQKYANRGAGNNDAAIQVSCVTLDFLDSSKPVNPPNEDERITVVIGGPPYSAGAGSGGGESMRRELPLEFVKHSTREYGASVVAFLMPERCAKVCYHNNNIVPKDCQHATIALESPSTFYFQGQAEYSVHQPSTIQCFWKNPAKK